MSDIVLWPWVAILVLGVWHGINPGMGWLFAVALGLQERKASAVWRSLLPLALGHGLAIAAAIVFVAAVGLVLDPAQLKWAVAATLLVFGLSRLIRHRHPRWARMRVGMWSLTTWSLLMASAHGAGLMVLPFVLETTAQPAATPAGASPVSLESAHAMANSTDHAMTAVEERAQSSASGHAMHAAAIVEGLPTNSLVGLTATLVHTAGYLLMTGLLAVIVYWKLGLRLLGRVWINLDLLWGVALVGTALVTPLL